MCAVLLKGVAALVCKAHTKTDGSQSMKLQRQLEVHTPSAEIQKREGEEVVRKGGDEVF